jgi:hypothetical protein
MKSLKELIEESKAIEDQLVETAGELTPELEKSLSEIELKLPEKIDRYAYFLERVEFEANRLGEKADEYYKACANLTALTKRLKDNVKYQMISQGLLELKGKEERFTLTRGKPSVVIENESMVPLTLMVTTVVQRPAKDKIKEILEAGDRVSGCKLEPTLILKRSLNRGIK